MIVTPEMLEAATASVVLARIEEAGDEGYVPSPDERLAAEFLMRQRLAYRALEYQAEAEGRGARFVFYRLNYELGRNERNAYGGS